MVKSKASKIASHIILIFVALIYLIPFYIVIITSLKEKRDAIIASLDTRYKKLEDLKKQKKEIKKKIRIERRAIIRDKNERFSLNRELSRQQKLSTKLTVKYSNEAEEVISSQKYYPENVQKTR